MLAAALPMLATPPPLERERRAVAVPAPDRGAENAGGVSAPIARHLIVVSVDTLRPDHLGAYGYTRPTSPAIDRFALGGTLWEHAWATSPWTKPSHASLLTGRYPRRCGGQAMAGALAATSPHLAEWLASRGFETFAVVNASWLKMDGLERGFGDLEWIPYVQGRRVGSPVTETAIARFERRDPARRLFAFVHYMDVHSDYVSLPRYEREFVRPYDGPVDGTTQQLYRFALGELRLGPADRQNLIDRYDAGIRQIDDRVGALLEHLARVGLADETLVVFVSDHGEEFGEHGSVIHGHTQYEEVLRVPLVMRGPGIERGRRVAGPVSLVDVVPTVLARLGLPAPAGLDGRDLLAPADGPRALYAEADVTFPPPAPGFVPVGPHRAVSAGGYKLHLDLETDRLALYDLELDPLERHDVRERHPRVAALLEARLRAFLTLRPESAPVVPLNEAERTLLRQERAAVASEGPGAKWCRPPFPR